MTTRNDLIRDYHDRATRGLPLSDEERAELEAWYAEQDAEEAALLSANAPPALAILQKQIDAGLAKLNRTAQRIQTLASENEALRQEIRRNVGDLVSRK